ncbi:MAG: hypothetical protein ACQGTM_15600 [bacterium]
MIEKFFIVTEASPLFKEYFDWLENEKATREFACNFAKRHDLPTLISYDNTTFSIILDKNRPNPFKSQLKKLCTWTEKGELYDFKMNSPIGKAWIEELKAAKLKVLRRPLAMIYFSTPCGRWGWELFEYGDRLYLKTTSECEPNVPHGMTEIKGSEYYKVVEENDAEQEEKS